MMECMMKTITIEKTMGRDKTSPTHKFQITVPETFVEAVKEYGQERADHLWMGALLIEARSAYVTLITKKTDPLTPKQATEKMKPWGPRSEVGKRGDPVGSTLKKVAALNIEDKKALLERMKADLGL
jgi:hypothetical protein